MQLGELMTLDELAEQFGVTKRTIKERIKDGRLKGYKAFGGWVIFRSDLEDAIKTNNL